MINSANKRALLESDIECGNQPNITCSPPKKRRTNAYLKCIERNIPKYGDHKLRVNPKASAFAAEDGLFLNPGGGVINDHRNKYTQWVLACKFIIAANWKVEGSRIPQNMHFFVDDQQNICALVENENSPVTNDVVRHCNQIETAMVRKYRRQRMDNEMNKAFDSDDSGDSEDDDLVSIHDDMVYIVRIPAVYYDQNLHSSFYSVCCRAAKHLQKRQNYGHPLFQILFKNIANFDSFQLTVPMVSLRGTLYAMFCQFGLGVFAHDDLQKDHVMNRLEFRAFLGLYDCWKEIGRREQCRKVMYRCSSEKNGIDLDVMKLIVGWTGLEEMDDYALLKWTDNFDRRSSEYKEYKTELRALISNLKVIVDFHSK